MFTIRRVGTPARGFMARPTACALLPPPRLRCSYPCYEWATAGTIPQRGHSAADCAVLGWGVSGTSPRLRVRWLPLSLPRAFYYSSSRWFAPFGRGAGLRGVLRAGPRLPALELVGGPRLPSSSSPLPAVGPPRGRGGYGRAVSLPTVGAFLSATAGGGASAPWPHFGRPQHWNLRRWLPLELAEIQFQETKSIVLSSIVRYTILSLKSNYRMTAVKFLCAPRPKPSPPTTHFS